MTTASRAVERLISFSWTDWAVTMDEQRAALAVLRTDPDLAATIRDLNSSGMIFAVAHRLPAREIGQILGGGCEPGLKSTIRSAIIRSQAVASGGHPQVVGAEFDDVWLFDLSFEIQSNFRRLGARFTATPFNETSFAALIPGAPDAPFSGVGATGTAPATLRIGPVDQALLAAGDRETERRYSNPIPGSLPAYLAGLSPAQRLHQAQLLLSRPLSSIVPYSYASRLPSRGAVIGLAAARYLLEPALLAAFILAEQRDQSRNEDAKDLIGARSLLGANTSIGLGQIVVSTVGREDLFSDLLGSAFRSSLSHSEIALLLTSEELNIFGVAKYLRLVANRAAGLSIASLPNTRSAFPAINLSRYAGHSGGWPDDNIRALGSEYTSRAWDDRLVPAWGEFVLQAYRDVRGSGVFAP